MIQSSVWDEAVAEGHAKGVAEGLANERTLCVEMIRKHHPELLDKATPAIQACDDPVRLKEWILAASEPDPGTLARLLGTA